MLLALGGRIKTCIVVAPFRAHCLSRITSWHTPGYCIQQEFTRLKVIILFPLSLLVVPRQNKHVWTQFGAWTTVQPIMLIS